MYLNSSRRRFSIKLITSALALITCECSLEADGTNSEEKRHDEKHSSDEKVYEPGGEVRPPKLQHYVEPQFSPSSKEAFVEGVVKISTVVTTDGLPTELRVVSGLNAEEDRTAMDALKQWRFEPGSKAGQPVKVRVTVEVDFHLM